MKSVVVALLFLVFILALAYDVRRNDTDTLRGELFHCQNMKHYPTKVPTDCNSYGVIHCGAGGEFCCPFLTKRNGVDYSNDCFNWK